MKTNESDRLQPVLCSGSQGPACMLGGCSEGDEGDGLALPLSLMEMYEMPLGMGLSAWPRQAVTEVWRAF